ncbi:MAG: CPBP family intramembrane metalloprotease [Syntrophomonadaceae bacterium]|nr:CPBP family intramembrane metalloprotease [Syntrophomonadaceae bacterium]
MEHIPEKPEWSLLDFIVIYAGIIIIGALWNMNGEWLSATLIKSGLSDDILTLFLFSFVVQFTITLLLIWLVIVRRHRISFLQLGIRWTSSTNFIKYGLLGGLLLLLVIISLSYPLQWWQPELEPQIFEEMLYSATSWPQLLVLLLIGAVLAPFSEELLYRGVLYPLLRYPLGTGWGMAAAGIIFGLVHWDAYRTIPLAVGGAILCYIYEKTGSIFVTTLAHGVWNGVMAVIVYITYNNLL